MLAAPVGFQEESGTAPASQINVPLGWVMRKQAMERSVAATSSGLSEKRERSVTWMVPQSKTYSLRESGGFARRGGGGSGCSGAPGRECETNTAKTKANKPPAP